MTRWPAPGAAASLLHAGRGRALPSGASHVTTSPQAIRPIPALQNTPADVFLRLLQEEVVPPEEVTEEMREALAQLDEGQPLSGPPTLDRLIAAEGMSALVRSPRPPRA